MFTRKMDKSDDVLSPSETTRVESRLLVPLSTPALEKTVSHIGSDLTIIGSIEAQGEVIFDGRIEGDIVSGTIFVGDGAVVVGKIKSNIASVKGSVIGTVWARKIALLAGSKVEGDIYHNQLSIEEGAYFEGRSRRSDVLPESSSHDEMQPSPATPDFA